MLKMKDLLEEGRKIQEKFKKNVLSETISEAETIKSQFDSKLSIKVGGDSATLITPFGSITIGVAGQYDKFSTKGGISMDFTTPKGGISRDEWEKATDRIFDFVSNGRNYLESLKKLLNPKILTKYLPQITQGATATSPSYTSSMSSVKAGGTGSVANRKEKFLNQDTNKVLKKIPYALRNKQFRYVGGILNRRTNLPNRGLFYPFNGEIMSTVFIAFREDEQKSMDYLNSLYMKPNDRNNIYTNFRGKEELEFVRLY
jgi:hypothetical protein